MSVKLFNKRKELLDAMVGTTVTYKARDGFVLGRVESIANDVVTISRNDRTQKVALKNVLQHTEF